MAAIGSDHVAQHIATLGKCHQIGGMGMTETTGWSFPHYSFWSL